MKILRPDDLHVHFRSGSLLRSVVPYTDKHFGRALVMPNVPAIENAEQVCAYKNEIMAKANNFTPLMTIKLTHRTTPEVITEGGVIAAKLYPQGATTGSHDGIVDPIMIFGLFEVMEDLDMVLCIHAEEPNAFVLDREKVYLDRVREIISHFPKLRIVIEHITTEYAVEFVREAGPNVGATITAHHLYNTLDDVIGHGLRPHNFCYPVPKRRRDREKLVAATYQEKFFFGSDSAPHLQSKKESACGCAGVFSAPALLPALATLFEDDFDTLQSFMSERGADFYKLTRSQDYIELVRKPFKVPEEVDGIIPWMAGHEFPWSVEDDNKQETMVESRRKWNNGKPDEELGEQEGSNEGRV